ncbi:28352_t:CDS:2, partial [Racocetra persica]
VVLTAGVLQKITRSDPGEIFVFRNIANQFNITDLSALSVIEYTIEELKVDHIIVCGHYGCDSVNASISKDQDDHTGQNGYTGLWVQNIKEVELNVKKQIYNICATDIVQRAWKRGRKVFIHGLVYNIETGLLKDLNAANCLEILSKPLDFPVDEKIIIQHSELPPVTDEFSVTLRFKLESYDSNWIAIFHKGAKHEIRTPSFWLTPTTAIPHAQLSTNVKNYFGINHHSKMLELNKWYHLGYILSVPLKRFNIYLNCEPTTPISIENQFVLFNDDPLKIGHSPGHADFKGQI